MALQYIMDLGLQGKIALVTGGSGNIGFEIAHRLGQEGAGIAICGRNSESLIKACTILEQENIPTFAITADVTNDQSVASLIQAVTAHYGNLDILVNNPGGIIQQGAFSEVELEHWRLGLELNVLSVISVSQRAIPYLKASPWGRIVNLGAFYISPSMPEIFTMLAENAVAKTSVSALTKVMSEELAPTITVNCVAPGPVGNDHPLQHVTKNFPIPRPATTDEIADLVAFLCSSRAGYLTGLTIPFDGGACRRMV
jgi:3-oxoacyl-[acyl-carrier protein] reductase